MLLAILFPNHIPDAVNELAQSLVLVKIQGLLHTSLETRFSRSCGINRPWVFLIRIQFKPRDSYT
jgi:hypothetical protein